MAFSSDPENSIARWQKRVDLRAEFEALKLKEREIKLKQTGATDLKKNIELAYSEYHDQLIQNAVYLLKRSRGLQSGLKNFYKFANLYHLDSYLPIEILYEAADIISQDQESAKTSISDASRKKKLNEIETKKQKIQAELAEASPPEDFHFNDGAVSGDLIDQFVSHWRELQRWTKGEVSPQGLALKYASEIVQRFYYRLKLNEIKPFRSAKYRPFEPVNTQQ